MPFPHWPGTNFTSWSSKAMIYGNTVQHYHTGDRTPTLSLGSRKFCQDRSLMVKMQTSSSGLLTGRGRFPHLELELACLRLRYCGNVLRDGVLGCTTVTLSCPVTEENCCCVSHGMV